MKKQEENFLQKFGEPLDKREFLFLARKAYVGQIEQYLKTQIYHLQGSRMLGFIRQMQEEIETAALATEDQMAELLKGLENEQESSKGNSRKAGKGGKLALVHAGSDSGTKPPSTPGS